MFHRTTKGLFSLMEFLSRDDLSKDDCPCATHQGFYKALSQIASTRMIKNHKLPLIVCMVSFLAESHHQTLGNIKDVFIKSTTCVVGWSVQDIPGFSLLPSPYLCNFLLWHNSSLCGGPIQVTITCHMSNVMEIEALYLIYE